VTIVFLELHPRFIGGSERMTLALCRHARMRGHHTVLAYAQDGDMVPAYRSAADEVFRIDLQPLAVRHPWRSWRSVRSLAALCRRVRADWIFTSQIGCVSLIARAAAAANARSAVHLGLVLDFASPLFRHGLRLIDRGIAPSPQTARAWQDRGWPVATLQVIPNGVDAEVFGPGNREAAQRSLGLPPRGGSLVAFVGRLVREKGIFTLLQAFAQLRSAHPEAHLLLVGFPAGQEVAELQALGNKLGLPPASWTVLPPVSDVAVVYHAADLVVAPSEWDEPFGLVPLEAMACGTPAVVSDRNVLPDFVAPLGRQLVFPSGDSAALADRLSHWLGRPEERARTALVLREHVRTHYSFADCGDAYLSAFASRPR
jgi:glycosyltransferase involved in cell wall biosynthesis